MDVREKLVELHAAAPTAERRMIMDEVKYYPYRMDYPNLCKPYTNADRIRNMSDEELAMCLYEIGYERGWGALEGTLEWLRKPAKEADNETVGERKDGND